MEIPQIIQVWQSQGVQLQTGATVEAIAAVEQQIGFVFPESFKEFYKLANRFANRGWTPELFHIWPIEEIGSEWELSQEKEFIPSCDFLINFHQIGFLKNKLGLYKRYKDKAALVCADFAQLLRLIVADAPEVN